MLKGELTILMHGRSGSRLSTPSNLIVQLYYDNKGNLFYSVTDMFFVFFCGSLAL